MSFDSTITIRHVAQSAMASRYLFLINIFVLLCGTAACGNPFLRSSNNNNYDGDAIMDLGSSINDLDVRQTNKRSTLHKANDDTKVQVQNGNKDDVAREKLNKLAGLSDDEIATALSRFSVAELATLDRFMDETSIPEHMNEQKAVDKRETASNGRVVHDYDYNDDDVDGEDATGLQLKRNANGHDYYDDYYFLDDGGRNNADLSKRCENTQHDHSEQAMPERRAQLPGEYRRHMHFKRMAADVAQPYAESMMRRDRTATTFNLAADKHVQAKINLLREKQKRQMACKSR